MERGLKQNQRIFVAFIYLAVSSLFYLLNIVKLGLPGSDSWIFSGLLLIVFGMNFTEPFFAKPIDVLVNSVTALLIILNIQEKTTYFGYVLLLAYVLILLFLTVLFIIFKDYNSKFVRIAYYICTNIGTSKVVFSMIFLSTVFTFFFKVEYESIFVSSLILWFSIVVLDIGNWLLHSLGKIFGFLSEKLPKHIGYAIKFEDNRIITAEIHGKDLCDNSLVGVVDDFGKSVYLGFVEKYSGGLVEKVCRIKMIYLDDLPVKISREELNLIASKNQISESEHSVYLITNEEMIKKYTSFRSLESGEIGYVLSGTDINKAIFRITNTDPKKQLLISEGRIIQTKINGDETLYQIINGLTIDERINSNFESSFVNGMAKKIGRYDLGKKEIVHVKWIPNNYSSFYLNDAYKRNVNYSSVVETSIGRLPNTDYEIEIKDYDSLVTHNTAILGILGIGKSCLTFELIKKLVKKSIKIICIDITNQYQSSNGLLSYVEREQIQVDIPQSEIDKINFLSNKNGSPSNTTEWGNVEQYKKTMSEEIVNFMNSDKKIMIINPENCEVTKAATNFKIEELVPITSAEKTRYISESLLNYAKQNGQTNSARYLIVYEEAHSLIPEWNSAASGSDQLSSNGTARVILQGRKYGLGCIITTQRTANVSKSILNQCNTIFALRVYDDTGKAFLENYIGSDYSALLPTLEERYAIVMGKGFKLKQPIIIELNDAQFVRIGSKVSEL